MTSIYILRLADDKFYVGKSSVVQDRILQHFSNEGSIWTRLHRPLDIMAIHPDSSPFDEDKWTKEMMGMYGIDNVRGGSYVETELDDETVKFLEREMRGATDKCFFCGSSKHFASACRRSKIVKKEEKREAVNKEEIVCYKCQKTGHYSTACKSRKKKKSVTCFRCNKKGHYASKCPTLPKN